MRIHIIEAEEKPAKGSIVTANCGKQLVFEGPVAVEWDDGRVCGDCLEVYTKAKITNKKTFAFIEHIT